MDIEHDVCFENWQKSLHKGTASTYKYGVFKFVEFTGMTPTALIEEARTDYRNRVEPWELRHIKCIEDFIIGFSGQANFTKKTYIKSVKSFYRFHKIPVNDVNHSDIPSMPSEEYLDTPLLKLGDIRRAVQNCGTNTMLKAIILTFLSSGQAQAEILKLKGKHLKNIVSGVAIVSMTRGKTNKRYTFFIGKEALDAIREYKLEIRDEDFVFTQIMKPEKPLYNPLVGAMFSRHAEKLGMKRKYFAPHRFRHYFKTTLTGKVDSRFVEFWMGHKLGGVESSYFLGGGISDEMLDVYIKNQSQLTVNTEPEVLQRQYDELKSKRDRDNEEYSALKSRLELLENYVHNLEMAEVDIMEQEQKKQ